MGVADRVRTSTSRLSCLSRSLAATPKRCSSSTTTRPRSLNRTSFDSSRWVPMTMSTRAVGQPLEGRRLGRRRHEPRQQPDLDREGREALRERGVVLGGEDRGRDQDRDLLAVLDRLERGPQRDLGLAVADVADDQPVHRPGQLHVGLDLGGGAQLVDRLLVRERRLHLGLPRGVGTERVALGAGARRVQREQLLGQVVDRLADALLGPQPLGAAELGERRPLAARVAGDPADLLDRDEDPVAAGERELEVVAILAGAAAPEHLLVARHAVVDVDDEVARREALEDVARDDAPERLRPPDADRPEQLAIGDEREAVGATDEPAVEAALDQRDRARRRRLPHPPDDRDRVAGLAQHVGQPRRLVRGEDDPGVVGPPGLDGLDKSPGTTGRQDGLPPPERVARGERAAGHRDVLGRDRFPGELEGPRADEAALPVARRQVGRRASPSAARRPRPAPRGARRPGATGSRRPRRCRPARRARAGCPDRCGRGRSPGRGGRPRPRRRPRRPSPGSRPRRRPTSSGSASNRARSAARRSGSRAAARPRRSRIAAAPPAGSRNSDAGSRTARSIVPVVRWSVGSNERSESISSPKNSIRIGSAIDGGKTSTIPPRRADSPRPATSLTGT